MAKRGLFQSIFGGKSEKNKDFHAYKLLSSWESTFVPYSGNMWDINTVRSAVDAFAAPRPAVGRDDGRGKRLYRPHFAVPA